MSVELSGRQRQNRRKKERHRELRYCVPCGLKTLPVVPDGRCPSCGLPLTARTGAWTNKQGTWAGEPRVLERARAGRYAAARERSAARRAAEEVPVESDLFGVWLSDQPGHPLGSGMPMGLTLRLDGESHHNALLRILRGDPCAYCGSRISGTVDHVVPKSTGQRGVERWPNLVGACAECNRRKSSMPLLLFLLQQRQTARQVALIRENRPDRSMQEAEAIAKAQRKKAKRRQREQYAA